MTIPKLSPDQQNKYDEVMEDVSTFASTWSVVGGRFDAGNALEYAEEIARNR